MSEDKVYTSLRIKRRTAEMLRKLGVSGESADDILNKLIDEYKNK